ITRTKTRYSERPNVFEFPRGMVMVERGQPIGLRQMVMLQEEHRAYQRSLQHGDRVRRGVSLFLTFSLLTALVVIYVARFQTGLAQTLPTIVGVCALVVVTLALGLLLSRPPWHAVLIPLTVTTMILTIVYNPQFALLMSFSLSLAMTVALGTNLEHLLVQMG